MPLTPLRRQLRSVLASLRHITCDGSISAPIHARSPNPWKTASPRNLSTRTRTVSRSLHHGRVQQQSAAAALAVADEREETFDWSDSVIFDQDGQEKHAFDRHDMTRAASTNRAAPFATYDDFTPIEAIEDAGTSAHAAPTQSQANEPSQVVEEVITVETILARFTQHRVSGQPGQVEWDVPFVLTDVETEVLARSEHSENDVKEWAAILSTADSLEAASALLARTRAHGRLATPLCVTSELLGRDYVSARALRVLVKHAEELFESWPGEDFTTDDHIFRIFLRLFRHARKVWPAALDRIVRIILGHLVPVKIEEGQLDATQMQRLTNMLNKVLRLIVVPTAIQPIKNNEHQEAALVRVLQFMVSHEPTLQISREGYRAVTLLQLAQRKTEKEQQWAELKTLSWPPWKEDRTAMDSYITADDHGVSKAAGTLLRMREAGYAPHGWERTAMIYAGWDTDRTPTIQTLTLLGSGGARFRTGSAMWAARIATTRTAQEAWAAYLAYEDETKGHGTSPDQEVHLATLNKLRKEDLRRSRYSKDKTTNEPEPKKDLFKTWRIFPGGTREVSPLPPSIHLYTYTRTEPPNVDEFYRHMTQKGVLPRDHCLAFLVANAKNLKLGQEYLMHGGHGQDMARALFDLNQSFRVETVAMPLYVAYIQLLCRFSKVPLPSRKRRVGGALARQLDVMKDRKIATHIAIVHAIALLQWRRPLYLPPYNAVLESLGHTSSYQNLRSVQESDVPIRDGDIRKQTHAEQELEELRGAITAYHLGQQVFNLMRREVHVDLDIDGFRALCHIHENAAFATWTIACDAVDLERGPYRMTQHLREAIEWQHSSKARTGRLRGEFRILVGDDSEPAARDVNEDLEEEDGTPPLEVPSFSLLHTYIRALGWMADYDGLLETVRWMRMRAAELATRQKQDRNGGVMMHRTLCALRCFLERSWILPGQVSQAEDQGQDQAEDSVSTSGDRSESASVEARPRPRLAKQLARLRSPAPREVIDEVKDIVEGVESWGGWPEDEDVEVYCRDKRFARLVAQKLAVA